MQLTALLLALTVVAPPGWQVERTVMLPDSFSGVGVPGGLCVDSARGMLYVADVNNFVEPDMCITGYDIATRRAVVRFATNARTEAIALHPDRNLLYHAETGEDYLGVYDCTTGERVARVRLPGKPEALWLHRGRDRLYIEVGAKDTGLVAIDCATNTIVSRIPVGTPYPYEWEHGLLVGSERSDRVFVLIEGIPFDQLRAVDCSADTVCARLDLGDGSSWGPVYEPVNDRVFVAIDFPAPELRVLDCAADTWAARIPCRSLDLNATAICCGLDGRRAWVYNEGEGIETFDLMGMRNLSRLAAGPDCGQLGFEPTTRTLIVADQLESGYQLYDACDLTWRADLPGGLDPWEPPVPLGAGLVAVACQYSARIDIIDCRGDSVLPPLLTRTTAGGLAVDSAGLPWFADLEANLLCRLDPDEGQVLSTIAPLACNCVASDGRLVAVPGRDRLWFLSDCGLALVCPTSGEVLLTAGSDIRPSASALSPQARRLACEDGQNVLLLADLDADSIVARLEPGCIRAVCADSAGRFWVVAGGQQARLTAIEADTLGRSVELPVLGAPSRLAYHAGIDLLYTAGSDLVSYTPNDTTGARAVCRLPGSAQALVPNTLHDLLYIATRGYLRVLDCRAETLFTASLCSNPGAGDILYDPWGDCLYFARDDGSLLVFDGATQERLADLQLPPGWPYIEIAPDRSRLYHAAGTAISFISCPTHPKDAVGEHGPTLLGREVLLRGTTGADLVDVTGRHVAALVPGYNYLGGLAVGIYFLRRANAGTVQKVIIRR